MAMPRLKFSPCSTRPPVTTSVFSPRGLVLVLQCGIFRKEFSVKFFYPVYLEEGLNFLKCEVILCGRLRRTVF